MNRDDDLGDLATIIAGPDDGASESSPRDAEPGPLFADRYRLVRELGRGGMGVVYEAIDTLVGDPVALKTLELAGGGEAALERFRREVRLARRITHPNVARTHDLGDHGGRHYLTMELVRGVDLATVLEREAPLEPARAVSIAAAISEGLAAAHSAGVIHRDLKPANVLIEAGGRVVLTDFGIARATEAEGGAETRGTLGTLLYMAPEQLTGGAVDPRTDLYALGLVLHEMIAGAPAYAGPTALAAAVARLDADPPDLRAIAPSTPAGLAALVRRLTARDPEARPVSAGEARRLLEICLNEQVSSDLSSGTEPHATPRPATGGVERSVAVLPLRIRGGDDDGLGEGLCDALIDLLGRTRGVQVQSRGAVARLGEVRDPEVIGRALGVSLVVDGALQRMGSITRATVSVVDVADGVQLWSGRFESSAGDPFEIQDRLSLQIAEALRIEIALAPYRERAGPDLLALYRNGRTQALIGIGPIFEGLAVDFDLGAAALPDFAPLVALRAVLGLRAWFVSGFAGGAAWEPRARGYLADAEARAGDAPETLLAVAMLAVQEGRYRDAVVALARAIGGAPGYPAAIQYLGSLQCEAGRADEGLERIRLSLEIEPRLPAGLFELARCSALRGEWDAHRETLDRMRRSVANQSPVLLLELRAAAWRGDLETIAELQIRSRDEPGPIMAHLDHYAEAALHQVVSGLDFIDRLLAGPVNPRFRGLLRQVTCEQLCLAGDRERALVYFLAAADDRLIDLEWCDRCPLLALLRGLPEFAAGRRRVRERVEAIWAPIA